MMVYDQESMVKQASYQSTLTFQSVETVVKFLLSYTEQHGLLLSGRVPGYSMSDIKLLPSSASKRTIWKTYQAATEGCKDVQCVAYSTFNKLWNLFCLLL